jgi:hypothetical protein
MQDKPLARLHQGELAVMLVSSPMSMVVRILAMYTIQTEIASLDYYASCY